MPSSVAGGYNVPERCYFVVFLLEAALSLHCSGSRDTVAADTCGYRISYSRSNVRKLRFAGPSRTHKGIPNKCGTTANYNGTNQEISGRVYEGGWEKGLKKGEGTLHTGTGQVYEGHFDADLYHGHGVLRGPGKDVLEGEWKWGRLNGENKTDHSHVEGKVLLVILVRSLSWPLVGVTAVSAPPFSSLQVSLFLCLSSPVPIVSSSVPNVMTPFATNQTFVGEAECKYKGGLRYTGGMLNGEFHGKGKLVFGKKGGWYEGHYRLGRQARYKTIQKELRGRVAHQKPTSFAQDQRNVSTKRHQELFRQSLGAIVNDDGNGMSGRSIHKATPQHPLHRLYHGRALCAMWYNSVWHGPVAVVTTR